jgi:hypothetical protein
MHAFRIESTGTDEVLRGVEIEASVDEVPRGTIEYKVTPWYMESGKKITTLPYYCFDTLGGRLGTA